MVLIRRFIFVLTAVSAWIGTPSSAILEFELEVPHDGYLTLVLDSARTRRVRNLLAEAQVTAGTHRVQWDLETDSVVLGAGIPGVDDQNTPVLQPGLYHIHGLLRGDIDLRYEFTVYNGGTPGWETVDGTGQWMADHTPTTGALYIPETNEIVLCSPTGESSPALIWIDSTGRKIAEKDHLWGWKAAWCLTREPKSGRVFGVSGDNVWELVGRSGTKLVRTEGGKERGIAAFEDMLMVSYENKDKLAAINLPQKQVVGYVPVESPRGCVYDEEGTLLLLSSDKLLRGTPTGSGLAEAETLLTDLDEPYGLFRSPDKELYIALWGNTHAVQVYDSSGTFLRRIGNPGPIGVGPYDSLHMQRPFGMALDGAGRLWIAEVAYVPKRVSVWDPVTGELLRAVYGPTKYGGGGALDPRDTTRFYYAEERGRGTLEFSLDWETGEARVQNILHSYGEVPQTPLYVDGRRFLTNEHAGPPTNPVKTLHVYDVVDGVAEKVGIVGAPPEDSLLKTAPFSALWNHEFPGSYLFTFSDRNENREMEVEEVAFLSMPGMDIRAVSVGRDLSCTMTGKGGVWTMPFSHVSDAGVPTWAVSELRKIGDHKKWATRSSDGALACYGSPLTGETSEGYSWEYPSRWLNVHGSWGNKTPPTYSGELIGVTKFLNGNIVPKNSDIGELFVLNGNMGNMYVFTYDGLLVATLFQDSRVGAQKYGMGASRGTGRGGWHMPVAERGMLLNDVGGGEEHFWPSITQTQTGSIYCTVGHEHSSLVRVDGLETCRRIRPVSFTLDSTDLTTGTQIKADLDFLTGVRPGAEQFPVDGCGKVRVIRIGTRLVLAGNSPGEFRLFAADGSLVMRERIERRRIAVELGALPAGFYVYRVRAKGGSVVAGGRVALVY